MSNIRHNLFFAFVYNVFGGPPCEGRRRVERGTMKRSGRAGTLNLMQAFGSRRRDLVDAALALAGKNAGSHRVTLRLAPTVDTALGPIRYPVPITLLISAPESR